MDSVRLKVEDVLDRTKWKRDKHSGDPDDGKSQEKEEIQAMFSSTHMNPGNNTSSSGPRDSEIL